MSLSDSSGDAYLRMNLVQSLDADDEDYLGLRLDIKSSLRSGVTLHANQVLLLWDNKPTHQHPSEEGLRVERERDVSCKCSLAT